MTKEELKKEAEDWIIKNSREFITNPNYSPFDYAEGIYIASAEPREKQIEIDAEQIRALQKQNGELTDKVKELEAQIEKMKWHKIADGDLPKAYQKCYFIYSNVYGKDDKISFSKSDINVLTGIYAFFLDEETIHDEGFQKGIEFGYNKANEWHYVKDELPEKEKYVLIYTNVGNVYISRLVKDNYFINKKGGFVQTSAVIAWKEIVLPKEIKEK